LKLYAKDEKGKNREVVAVYKGSADGTPIKLEEDTLEYLLAVREGVVQGVISLGD